MSHILFDISDLICYKDFPFLPKYLFFIDKTTLLNYNLGDDLQKCIQFIKNYTCYKIDNIMEYITFELSPYQLLERLNLEYICEVPKTIKTREVKCGIFVYIYYFENLEKELDMLTNVPQNFDIYICSDNKQKVAFIKKMWRRKKRKNTIKFMLHKYRGRDISALLLTFKPFIKQYDIFCYIHDKKSSQMGYPTVGSSFNLHIWECLIGNQSIVNYAVAELINDKWLGILAPPFIFEGMYFYVAVNPWTICYEKTRQLGSLLKLNTKILDTDNITFLGSCFWAKTKALKKLLEYKFKESDFPEEPCPIDGTINHCIERIFSYVALDAGFYTGHILSVDIAKRELIMQRHMLISTLMQMRQMNYLDVTTFESFINSIIKNKKG